MKIKELSKDEVTNILINKQSSFIGYVKQDNGSAQWEKMRILTVMYDKRYVYPFMAEPIVNKPYKDPLLYKCCGIEIPEEKTNNELSPSMLKIVKIVAKVVFRNVREEISLNTKLSEEEIDKKVLRVVNKIGHTPYFDKLVCYLDNLLNNVKCGLYFIDTPAFINIENEAQVVGNYEVGCHDFNDENKILYFYSIDFRINIDFKKGKVPDINDEQFLKSFYLRCRYEDNPYLTKKN